ncbi:ABC transporter ATP-binding protein [Psychroflexus planctonicus]|uniref:Multidrug ABC transporter ATP-binding protein n=1 Tax=Psychroflexus planctonicus TaxID=1526575 RepID=A0ABQ1SHU5_9FLAO|nr:ABC transporter transmembrane domain-containing protein [Psychroflexus planctonicus]GGE37044.1 multidrug ABC transporter ATP-binding protein [Psychroflexus planctonicus]
MAKKKTQNDLPKASLNASNLKRSLRLFKYVGPHKWKLILGLVFLSFTGLTALLFPKLMGDLIETADFTAEDINRMGLILLALFTAQAIFSFFRVVLFVNVTENMLASIRKDTFSTLIKMPMQFFSSRKVSELNSRIAADIGQIQDTFTTGIAEFLRQFIIVIGGVIALFFTSVKLSLLMLATIPVFAIVAVFFGKYIRKLAKDAQDEVAESNSIASESLQGIANVKAFTNEFFEMLRYDKAVDSIKKIAIKGGLARGAFSSFIIFCIFGAIVLLVWYAVKLQNQDLLTQSELITFILYTIFVGASIGGLPIQYAQIQKAVGATERVFDIIDEQTESLHVKDRSKIEELELAGNIHFKNVDFHYPSRPEIQVLANLNFKVNAGETIAIVGPSGAGKSTIAALLLQFYKPTNGEILIDDKSCSTMDLYSIREEMAYVQQEVFLFGGSILENIQYGKPEANLDEIKEAAKKANAHQFIEDFPEQYDTIVGERGIQLSGGQRQRIAIARAVLKNPSILILDEATSALDAESEHLVQEALQKLMKGRTSFVIAHRLSTIQNADQILVLENGKLLEKGTHQELIANPLGRYKNLVELQLQS